MEMEPLQSAIAVIEGVTEEICRALGDAAREFLNPDRLFATAEDHIRNGLSIDAATTQILAFVLPETKERLKESKSSENDSDSSTNSARSSPFLKHEELIKKEVNVFDCKFQNISRDPPLSFVDARIPFVNGPSTSTAFTHQEAAIKQERVDATECPSQSDTKPLQLFASPVLSPEICVLSPPPKAPAPLIDLSDDSSCSGPSSCNSDIVVVGELENRQDAEPKLRKQDLGCKVLKQPYFCVKTNDELFEFDKELAIGASNSENSESSKDSGVDNDVNQSAIAEQAVKAISVEIGANMFGESSGILANYKTENREMDYDKVKSHASQTFDDQSSSSETVNQLDNDNFRNENRREIVKRNGEMDYYDSDSLSGDDPTDMLWKDAQFICSLLPYFELADVHQTMLDNFYHPDRKAHVLEAYIELALDRDEMVPDTVFLSLNAARKRSHDEDRESHSSSGKRLKVDQIDKGPVAFENESYNPGGNVIVEANEPVPSTSGIVVPSAVVSNGPIAGTHAVVNDAEYQRVGSEREKWYKEKMDFISAVVHNVEKHVIRAQLENCFNDTDVEALLLRLMEEQSRLETAIPPTVVSENSGATHYHPGLSAFRVVDVDPRTNEDPNPAVEGSSSDVPSGEGEEAPSADIEDRISAQIETLSEMFNDADPDYLRERCIGINGKQVEFQALVEELMEKKNYPKMEEYLKRQKRLEIKKKFIEGMSVEDFLGYFEDPEKIFSDTEKKMNATYMENAKRQLSRDLPYHLSKDIESELRKNNHHYLPTLRALEGNKKLSRRKTKRGAPVKESDLDDIFIKELCYARMQVEIKEYLLKKEEAKRRAFLWAKTTNQLRECGCCYDDEILEDDMDTCSATENKHKFCCNCIRRFAEEEIGQGRISFRCLEGDCKAEFSLGTLKRLMKPSVFSNILARKQLEEIAAAGIEDLESCPFCNFQTIMPNIEDKVFKCLNPECMKDSCRLCKEPNHVPLRCEEVERQNQKDARTFLENKMTEAMVRECWKCKKRFIKADGCNKMKCSCGAMMCYICKKAIRGYDHFEDNPVPINKDKCPLWSNSEKIHAEEVRDAAKKLKDELDPDIELKHDPTKDLPEVPKHLDHRVTMFIPAQNHPHGHQNPPPAHQRRHHPRRYEFFFGPPQAHHHRHHRHPMEANHQPPQPAHQHPPIPPIHLVINPGRNDYHHHHHHHYHHHVRPQAAARQDADDPRRLLEHLNEFNEIFRNVQHDHQQQQQQQQNQPLVPHQNPARFPAQMIPRHPPQNHVQNLPQEQAHDHFIGEL